MGRLHVCPAFLVAVPRSAMIRAIGGHFTSQPTEGESAVTRHEHQGAAFLLETDAARSRTRIRLGCR
jgi:hypothetical protein